MLFLGKKLVGQDSDQQDNSISIHIYGILTEYLFVIVPLVALFTFSLSSEDKLPNILSTAELSFAASVLFGQTIVKIVSGFSIYHSVRHWEPLALVVAFLIVFGLVPSVIVLAMMLIEPTNFIITSQIVLFIIASVVFIVFGSVGASFIERGQHEKAKLSSGIVSNAN